MKSGVSMRIFPPGIQLIWPRRCKGTWAVFGLEVSVAGASPPSHRARAQDCAGRDWHGKRIAFWASIYG